MTDTMKCVIQEKNGSHRFRDDDIDVGVETCTIPAGEVVVLR